MKKIVLFLVLFILGFNSIPNVEASSFYEGEFIPNIFMIRENENTRYFQRARVFRQKDTNQIAYCIQPFVMFNESGTYNATEQPDYLSVEQRQRVALLSYLGYGYEHRLDQTWYAVTQLLIWQITDPNGSYYFTDSLNGNYTDRFNPYIEELNIAVEHYLKQPSFSGQSFQIVKNQEFSIIDTNNTLSFYEYSSPFINIHENVLTISDLDEGEHFFEFKRINNIHGTPVIFYISETSQDQVIMGDVEAFTFSFNLSVRKTKLEIEKIDEDTKTTVASGEGKLQGAVYNLYDEQMNLIKILTIGDDFRAYIEYLPFGNYFIQEISPGLGYTLDPTIYSFEISFEDPIIFLQFSNKIIEQELKIYKQYGDGVENKPENGIIFDIFNHKGELVKSIITDHNGFAYVKLFFGNYKIIQRNTTPGYKLVDDFYINIADEDLVYHLYNYKIPVPNTGINNDRNISFLPILLGLGVYYKRKII